MFRHLGKCSWHLQRLPLSMTSLHQNGLSVSTGSLDQNLFIYCDRNLPPASELSFVSIGYVIERSVSVGVSLGITISRRRHCHQCPCPSFAMASTTLSVPCLQKIIYSLGPVLDTAPVLDTNCSHSISS